jgi:hypothetical protein
MDIGAENQGSQIGPIGSDTSCRGPAAHRRRGDSSQAPSGLTPLTRTIAKLVKNPGLRQRLRWTNESGKTRVVVHTIGVYRSLGQLSSNLKHELSVGLTRTPKIFDDLFLAFIQGFDCARGDGLGLPISLAEYLQGTRLFSTGVSSSLERVVKS